ncbi:MAG TPA: YceI family protein [Bryobacteraceae bacterium]|jgi:polyisoprenoid-binding protein YceI|nr:YceI family protein [Bryobacteraceae bacterium]
MTELAAPYTISPSNDSTLAIEVFKTGLYRRKKHILFFEKYNGELWFTPDRPEASQVRLVVEAASVVCRDIWLSEKKRQAVSQFVRKEALDASTYPLIEFTSTRLCAKQLRGFTVEGVLKIRGVTRVVKVNVVLSPRKNDRFQVDGDATLRLSDFSVPRPAALFGLAGTKNEALIRLLLWALPRTHPSN